MAKKFNLAEFIQPDGVSNSDHLQVTMIPWTSIKASEDNFYIVGNVDELEDSIRMHGLLDPVTVTPDGEPGRYKLISGHRRHKAWGQLRKAEPEKYAEIPAIVRTYASPHMAELALIMANGTSRVLSPAEVSKQAERVERLLYELKEEGYEFPGRMRDQVAKACQVSSSKLARLKVIREHLAAPWTEVWSSGKLAEDTAYKLAGLPEDFQARLGKVLKKPIASEISQVANLYEDGARWDNALKCPDGKACTHVDSFLLHDARCYRYSACKGRTCCLECREAVSSYGRCQSACSKADALYKDNKAKEEAKAEAARKRERTKLQKAMTASAVRLARALDAGDPVDDKEPILTGWSLRLTAGEIRAIAAGTFEGWADVHCSNDLLAPDKLDAETVRKLSTLTGVSADYIMGLSEDMYPEAAVKTQQETGVAADPQQIPAEEPEADAIPPRSVARWHDGMKGLPIDRPLLTWQLSNDGEVYRTAIWTGGRFLDTRNRNKELTGLYFTRWMEIPESGECCELPPPYPDWMTGEPTRDGRYLAVINMDKYGFGEYHEQTLERRGGAWYTYGHLLASDLDVTHWWPLPGKITGADETEEEAEE